MNKINLRWQDNTSPDIDAHNLQSMTDGINDLIDETENIENKISEIESTKVVANPKRKAKYALNTIMIGDDVYLVDGNAGSTKYDLLGKQVGEGVRFFQPSENAKQIILMAIYRRCFQGSAIIDLEEKTIKATSTSVENELYNKYLGQLWDENHASQNTFTYNYNADNDDYTFYWNGIDGFGTETLVYYAFDGNVSVRSSYYELEVAVISVEKSQEIGISTWEELENKPFESLNADNFEVSEDGVLSVIGGGGDVSQLEQRVERLEDDVDSLERNKVTQLTFNTGIDIGDWDRVIDPDEPVVYERYTNYHDAVAKLSQQIDIMGERTDNLNIDITKTYPRLSSANTNVQITQFTCVKMGNLCFAQLFLTLSANVSAWSSLVSGLPKNTASDTYFALNKVLGNTYKSYVTSGGILALGSDALASGSYMVTLVYTCQ